MCDNTRNFSVSSPSAPAGNSDSSSEVHEVKVTFRISCIQVVLLRLEAQPEASYGQLSYLTMTCSRGAPVPACLCPTSARLHRAASIRPSTLPHPIPHLPATGVPCTFLPTALKGPQWLMTTPSRCVSTFCTSYQWISS